MDRVFFSPFFCERELSKRERERALGGKRSFFYFLLQKQNVLAIGAGARKAMKRPSIQSESVAAALGRWRTKVETALGRRDVARRTIAPDEESIVLLSLLFALFCFVYAWGSLEGAFRGAVANRQSQEADRALPLRLGERAQRARR